MRHIYAPPPQAADVSAAGVAGAPVVPNARALTWFECEADRAQHSCATKVVNAVVGLRASRFAKAGGVGGAGVADGDGDVVSYVR